MTSVYRFMQLKSRRSVFGRLVCALVGSAALAAATWTGAHAQVTPAISINDSSVIEGNALGGPRATLNVSLSGPSTTPVSVTYATTGGTASTSTLTNFFANSASITINDNAAASPYPSAITVPGTIFGPVTKVRATLVGLSHTFPGDIDMILQGPTGATVMLMSDAGENGVPVSGANITFDDDAPTGVPATVVSGTFKPTNISGLGDDVFPAPAPAGPYGDVLSVFAGLNPAGQWRLYVRDDASLDVGSIATGWQIAITTQFSGGDYIFTSGTLTFPPGTTSQSIGIPIRGDTDVESDEAINVSLTTPVNATIADPLGVITIRDDDGPTPPVGAGKADIAIDFGSAGLWSFNNNATFSQLHNFNPSQLAAGDLDGNGKADVVVDFPGFGVWAYMNNTSWAQLHPLDVTGIATGDLDGNGKSDVLLNFPGYGVYVFANNTTWFQLHPANPTLMITGDLDGNGRAEAIMDFGGSGIWAWWNYSYWTQIHPFHAVAMAAGNVDGVAGDDLVISFASYGLFMLRNNLYWSQLHNLIPTRLAIGDTDNSGQKEIIIDFPSQGLWAYKNNSSFVQIHPFQSTLLSAADIDGNGRSDVLVAFQGQGLWTYMNDASWILQHNLNPDAIAPANITGNRDDSQH